MERFPSPPGPAGEAAGPKDGNKPQNAKPTPSGGGMRGSLARRPASHHASPKHNQQTSPNSVPKES